MAANVLKNKPALHCAQNAVLMAASTPEDKKHVTVSSQSDRKVSKVRFEEKSL